MNKGLTDIFGNAHGCLSYPYGSRLAEGRFLQRQMKIKINQGQKRNTDKEGKKRPFQDDTALILAVICIMVVAHAYVVAKLRVPAPSQRIVVTAQTGDVASAIGQNLSAQRQDIEEHIKYFMAIPEGMTDQALLAARGVSFSVAGWPAYQQYLTEQQKKLAEAGGLGLRAEFVLGSQKYAILSDGRTVFRAEGIYCFGIAEDYRCGPQRFIIELVMYGSISKPEALSFDSWRVWTPLPAAETSP